MSRKQMFLTCLGWAGGMLLAKLILHSSPEWDTIKYGIFNVLAYGVLLMILSVKRMPKL